MERPSWNRVHVLRVIMLKRAATALVASKRPGVDERYAAAMRGKAKGYREAAALIAKLERGGRFSKNRDDGKYGHYE